MPKSSTSGHEPNKPAQSDSESSKPVSRGPHAKRTAIMRRKLIEAATICLGEFGFGGTTMQRITDKAGVSRGAFLHHFPTRTDLLIAVAENAVLQQNRVVANRLADAKPGRDLFDAITMATWEAMMKPEAIALLEIMMGARSDPDLKKTFPSFIENLQTRQKEGVWATAKAIGITDRDTIISMVHLHVAAMRGLLLEYMYSGDFTAATKSMQLLSSYKDNLTETLLKK